MIFDGQHAFKPGCENEVVVFTDAAPPYTDRTRRISYTFPTFEVTDSVFSAAHDVAEWIRANKAELAA